MSVRDQFPDFFGTTALPGKGKKHMKPTKLATKGKAPKAPPTKKAKWQEIADQMGKC